MKIYGVGRVAKDFEIDYSPKDMYFEISFC